MTDLLFKHFMVFRGLIQKNLPAGQTSRRAPSPLPNPGLDGVSVTPLPASNLGKIKKLSGAKSGACLDSLSDSRLQALIAHWENLPEPLRESVFRQVCETIILQPFTNQPHTGGDTVSPSVFMEPVSAESDEHPNDERILS